MGRGRRGRGRIVAVLVAAALLGGCLRADVETLASDAMGGRNNNTPGSLLAQEHLLGFLRRWTVGIDPTAEGDDAYKQPIPLGTNLIGIIPGTDLADEYVLVGGHYDHLGSCRDLRPDDDICNGATDNAAGTAAVLAVARTFAYAPTPPRRSIIVAFWDREEDSLLGSEHFVDNPPVPLDDIVAYLNFDLLGANLRPSIRNFTFAIGAETGGTRLRQLVDAATAPGPLDTRQFSLVFGQGRSDHAPFAAAGVPVVFFGDSTGPCYHSDMDEIDVVDFGKLGYQVQSGRRLAQALASTDQPPAHAAGQPLATYDDAVTLHAIAQQFDDWASFPPASEPTLRAHFERVEQMVAEGPAEFDSTDLGNLLVAAIDTVSALTTGPCDGFLAEE